MIDFAKLAVIALRDEALIKFKYDFHHRVRLSNDIPWSMDQKRAGRLASLDVRRIQSLSDSVFAIVITILAFTLVVPAGEDDEGLKRFLWDQILPKLFIFFLGFIIVGAYWVDTHYNHHHIFKVDKTSIWLNIFFLMFICLIPFSSGFLANYLYSSISVIVYSINLILVSFWHLMMLIYSWRRQYIQPYVDKKLYRNLQWRIISPILIYFFALFPSPYLERRG